MSKIEWTDETWNFVVGCTRVSAGCEHCYAERQAFRNAAMGLKQYQGITKKVGDKIRWTGKIGFAPHLLDKPRHWKKPRMVFVNSMSDLYHEDVRFEEVDKGFVVMKDCPQHKFQILTKRPSRMEKYFHSRAWARLRNVWLGASAENQETYDLRRLYLDKCRNYAGVIWWSLEPLLGPINLNLHRDPKPDWIVVGGESGPGARPMNPDWARSVRDQCQEAGVAFFFKQHGAWRPCDAPLPDGFTVDSARVHEWHCGAEGLPGERFSINVGKKVAGRILDGRTWDELPGVAQGGTK